LCPNAFTVPFLAVFAPNQSGRNPLWRFYAAENIHAPSRMPGLPLHLAGMGFVFPLKLAEIDHNENC